MPGPEVIETRSHPRSLPPSKGFAAASDGVQRLTPNLPSSRCRALSYLREIMARLKERQSGDPAGTVSRAPADPQRGPLALEAHIQWYREQLRACSDPMLRYEWAWLEDHLSSLNLSSGHAEMRAALGGRDHVEQLVRETAAFRSELEQELRQRGLEASARTLPLEPMEHAWELSSPVIRQAWGIDQNGDGTREGPAQSGTASPR